MTLSSMPAFRVESVTSGALTVTRTRLGFVPRGVGGSARDDHPTARETGPGQISRQVRKVEDSHHDGVKCRAAILRENLRMVA